MPTLILLDCGLSMGRLVGKKEVPRPATSGDDIPEITLDDDTEIRHLAIQGVTQLLARMETNCRSVLSRIMQTIRLLCELSVVYFANYSNSTIQYSIIFKNQIYLVFEHFSKTKYIR